MSIAITALGCLTPLGHRIDQVFDALLRGEIAVRPWQDETGWSYFAGRMADFNPRDFLKQKGLAALSRSSLLASAAMALLDGGPAGAGSAAGSEALKTALVVGTAYGHLESKFRFCEEAGKTGVQLVSPILFPNTILNALGGHTAILYGLRGPNSTLSSGRASGLEALRYGKELIEAGRADRAAVVGCDEVSTALLRGLEAKGELASADPGGPEASLPYHPRRRGFYPGEAAAAGLLEKEPEGISAAGKRAPLGLLAGCGLQSAIRRSLAAAVKEAAMQALDEAGIAPKDLGAAVLSGSGAPEDREEAEALGPLLDGKIPSFAPKRALGESFGAAGVLGIALALECLRRRLVPPTPGASGPASLGLSERPAACERPWALVTAVEKSTASAAVLRQA